jgi:hypothetical protein
MGKGEEGGGSSDYFHQVIKTNLDRVGREIYRHFLLLHAEQFVDLEAN